MLAINDKPFTNADLFDDAESRQKSPNIALVRDVKNPRFVSQNSLLSPVREESEIAVGHVVFLGAK